MPRHIGASLLRLSRRANLPPLSFSRKGLPEARPTSEEGIEYMAQVIVRAGEPLDAALKRFKKSLQQEGTLKIARAHEYYEKPSDKKRKAEAARRRKLKQTEER